MSTAFGLPPNQIGTSKSYLENFKMPLKSVHNKEWPFVRSARRERTDLRRDVPSSFLRWETFHSKTTTSMRTHSNLESNSEKFPPKSISLARQRIIATPLVFSPNDRGNFSSSFDVRGKVDPYHIRHGPNNGRPYRAGLEQYRTW